MLALRHSSAASPRRGAGNSLGGMTTGSTVIDAAGNATTGAADGVARYDRALDLLLLYHTDLLGAVEELGTHDADMPMAQALLAYLSLMTTDIPDLDGARECARALDALTLNEREAAVLEGAAAGETAAQTGARLYLSPETVKSYRKRIIAKLGARNGTHAVALALRSGLLR